MKKEEIDHIIDGKLANLQSKAEEDVNSLG
jgi:hypothetical protein